MPVFPGTLTGGYTTGSGAPAGTGSNGDEYYDYTNFRYYRSDGVGWIILSEPVQTFTPTLTQSATVTKTVTEASYQRSNGRCRGNVQLAITSAGTAGNAVIFGLPIASAVLQYSSIGGGRLYDVSANLTYPYILEMAASNVTARGCPTTAPASNFIGVSEFTAGLASGGDTVTYFFDYPMTTMYS